MINLRNTTDMLNYSIINNRGHLTVRGERDSGSKIVYSSECSNFIEILDDLIDYHNDCFYTYQKGEKAQYYGAGSDRGEQVDREVVRWNLEDKSNSLLLAEKNLLKKIIGMHNQSYYFLKAREL